MNFDKSGGYRWLDSFVMANIVQLATFRFCEKFLNGDYETWLLRHGKLPWRKDSPEAKAVFDLRFDRPEYSSDQHARPPDPGAG